LRMARRPRRSWNRSYRTYRTYLTSLFKTRRRRCALSPHPGRRVSA
jgi:hypothetical protein